MEEPMKIMREHDITKTLENIIYGLQHIYDTCKAANDELFQFLESNPDIGERYKEFASGHPELAWNYNSGISESLEEQQEIHAEEQEEEQAEAQRTYSEETETQQRRRGGVRL